MIDIGEIIIIDKSKADTLLSLGFKYTTRNMNGKDAFVFLQTNELMKELSSKFDDGSFLVNKNICF